MSNLKPIQIRIDRKVVSLVDEIAKANGVSRCDIIRFFILDKLARMGYLNEDTSKALGCMGKTVRTPPIKNKEEG